MLRLQTEMKPREKLIRKQFKESKTVNLATGEGNHKDTFLPEKGVSQNRISKIVMERKNVSYDGSFVWHTCNISLKKYNSLDAGNEDPEELPNVVNHSKMKQTVDSRKK